MCNPPFPPNEELFPICIKFQEYVRGERAAHRDIWEGHLHEEDEFVEKKSIKGKEKVLS